MRTIVAPRLEDLLCVAAQLCASDRLELSLTRDDVDDYVSLAHDAWECPIKHVVFDREPVMAFGARPLGATALVWGFKTVDGWPAVPLVTRFILRTMIPALRDIGVRRAICLVHPLNAASQTWLRHLGFTPRATTREFGTRHEEVVLFQRDEPDA